MASLAGKNGVVQLLGTTVVTKVTRWEVTPTADALDDTGMSDGGERTFLTGLTAWTARCEVNFQTTQPPMSGALSLAAGQSIACRFDTDAVPSQRLSGTAIITSIPIRNEVAGLTTWSLELQGTGTLTIA